MNNRVLRPARRRGFALKELIVVIAVVVVLIILLLPALPTVNRRHYRFSCIQNLKQIGLASQLWADDNHDKFPMAVPISLGGSLEYTNGTDTYRHFQVMSNELSKPIIVNCPNDNRPVATNFALLSNSNISYFVNLDTKNDDAPERLLIGDRNIIGASSPVNGILRLVPGETASWGANMHTNSGNIGMADGSVQSTNGAGLTEILKASGAPTNTWRISLPE